MNMNNNNNARYKESRELREKDPNTNNKICFEVEPLLYVLVFTQKDFNYPL